MTDLPHWLGNSKKKKQQQNRRSTTHERQLAERVGGKRQTGSGNTWKAPNDVRSEEHLIEHKYTDGRSYSLKAGYLKKLLGNAERAGRGAVIVIDFDEEGIRITATVERT